MRWFRLSLTLSCLLMWGGIFGCVSAKTDFLGISPVIPDVYRVDSTLRQLPLIVWANDSLLGTVSSSHAAADQLSSIVFDMRMLRDFLVSSQGFDDFVHQVRRYAMQALVASWYTDFNDKPYTQGNFAITVQSWDFKVQNPVTGTDALDILLVSLFSGFSGDFDNLKTYTDFLDFLPISITEDDISNLWTLYFFKDDQDLRDLWYELISWKTRTNTDPDYRRHNITAAFSNIGNVRLIMPGETFSLAHEFHYGWEEGKIPYVSGYATFGSDVRLTYGGWLCGVATATYQWMLTNLWLDLLEYKAHTIYYRNLYEAEINGITIDNPWLDATIFSPNIDFRIQNIRDYPIVVAFNYDGTSWSIEQILTLSKPQDRGSFSYVGMKRKWWLTCYTWKINWENRTNCYSKVTDF